MSRDDVFVFVEGRDLDPFVYSKICAPLCIDAGKSLEVVVADRIVGDGGGKNILSLLFDYLENANSLVDRTGRSAKLAMFYMDKDADDLFGDLKASNHVVYTRYYSIENHLFRDGMILPCMAAAACVDEAWLRSRMREPRVWREEAATSWREWVALCLVARKLRLTHPVSYSLKHSSSSPLGDLLADSSKLAAIQIELEARSGLPNDRFSRLVKSAFRLTDALFRRSQHDLIFKGKWYPIFAIRELEAATKGCKYNKNGAADRLIGGLIVTLPFNEAWADHFKAPLRAALAAL